MTLSRPVSLLAALLSAGNLIAQTQLVGSGTSYSSPFSPAGSVTHQVPGGGLLSVTLSSGTTTSALGNWTLSASGAANVSLLGLGLLESGAQTQLTGNSLRFGISNDNDSLLGLLNTGSSLTYGWEATAWFDTPGSVLTYSPDSRYSVSFDLDGSSGLLGSVAGLTPSFSFELIDGSGNPLISQSGGTLINLVGIFGTGVPTGTVNLDYVVDSGSVPVGPIGIRFAGDSQLTETALGAGTTFATVSNLSLSASPVPEPTSMLLAATSLGWLMMRRRRLGLPGSELATQC